MPDVRTISKLGQGLSVAITGCLTVTPLKSNNHQKYYMRMCRRRRFFLDLFDCHDREEIVKHRHLILVVALLMAIVPIPMTAQQFYGSVTGTISDATGAVVPNANVRVTNVDTSVTVVSRTNSAGVYLATNLIHGKYRVEAEASGFKRAVANNIVLAVGATRKVDVS